MRVRLCAARVVTVGFWPGSFALPARLAWIVGNSSAKVTIRNLSSSANLVTTTPASVRFRVPVRDGSVMVLCGWTGHACDNMAAASRLFRVDQILESANA